jgi:hypothetical protein
VTVAFRSDRHARRPSKGLRTVIGVLAEEADPLAAEADLRDPAEFALSWHILMKGSIVQADEGDRAATSRAQTNR